MMVLSTPICSAQDLHQSVLDITHYYEAPKVEASHIFDNTYIRSSSDIPTDPPVYRSTDPLPLKGCDDEWRSDIKEVRILEPKLCRATACIRSAINSHEPWGFIAQPQPKGSNVQS